MLSGLGLEEPRARRRGGAPGRRRAPAREPLVASGTRAPPRPSRSCPRAGYRLGVVSNADGRVRALLEAAGVSPFLEFVVDSAEVGVEKPDARIFLAATERLGLAPAACAYVGDIYEIDVEGSRRAGLHPILIGEGHAPETVRRVAHLPDLLPIFPPFA